MTPSPITAAIEALEAFIAHERSYMTLNYLGDAEKQSHVIQARAALSLLRSEPASPAPGEAAESVPACQDPTCEEGWHWSRGVKHKRCPIHGKPAAKGDGKY